MSRKVFFDGSIACADAEQRTPLLARYGVCYLGGHEFVHVFSLGRVARYNTRGCGLTKVGIFFMVYYSKLSNGRH